MFLIVAVMTLSCLPLHGMSQPSSETNEKLPAIRARLCNAPLDSPSKTDASPRGLKRRNSSSSSPDDESDSEPLLLFGILQEIHRKFPRLNFLQYSNALRKKGFDYAESVGHFDREYFIQLGLPEGVVVIFLDGVQKALERQKTAIKRARLNSAKTDGL
jgi:hypothetical protein